MTTLITLGRESRRIKFSYTGSVQTGVTLQQAGALYVDATFFTSALNHFAGREVKGGFKDDDPPRDGFGYWIQENARRLNSRRLTPRHGAFVAAILCYEAGVESWLSGNAVWLRFPR
jgi:hypothetical protein